MEGITMRSLLPFLSLSIVLASACDRDTSDSPGVPVLAAPNASIPGGVGVKHTIKLMPAGSPEVERGEAIAYPKIDGRQPVKIDITRQAFFDVVGTACRDGVCTIEYTHKDLAEMYRPEMVYSIVDEANTTWTMGRLKLDGQIPKLEALKFNPIFNETIRITVPLSDENGAPLKFAPKLTQSLAGGGKVSAASCTEKECTLDYVYDQYQATPSIHLNLEGPSFRSRQTLSPQPEVVTLKSSKTHYYSNPASVRLVQGEHYSSSWKRPAPQISVVEARGMDRSYFQCSVEACVGTFNVRATQGATLFWSTMGHTQKAQLDLTFVDAAVKPALKEVVVDRGVKTLVTFEPGVDYTAAEGALATNLDIESSLWTSSLVIEDVRCDSQGRCSFNVRYTGDDEFVTRKYNLRIGSYKSPSQVIKIIPRIAASKATIELWEQKGSFQELVLEAGKDYTAQDGSKARAIVVASGTALKFRDTTTVTDDNRKNLFQCDEQGTCRAWIRNPYTIFDSANLNYAVETATGVSAEVSRTVMFKRDDIKPLTASRLYRIFGQTADQNLDRIQITLARGVDYSSLFPAEKVSVSFSGKNLTFTDGTVLSDGTVEVPCDSEGLCSLQGIFRSEAGYLDIEMKLLNSRGESPVIRSRLIREKFSTMLPNLSVIKLENNGTEEFDVTLKPGPGLGYDGDIKARRLQVEAINKNVLNAAAIEGTALVEVPCADDGSCSFRVRGERSSSNLRYRFLDETGNMSYLNSLTLVYPDPFATAFTASVPAEVNQVTMDIPIAEATNRSFHIVAQAGITLAKVTSSYRGFQVTLNLEKPLTVGQTVSVPYFLTKDGRHSNEAILTLNPFQPLSLKSDVIVPAVKGNDGSWSVTLRYGDHFNPLTSPGKARYYFSERMSLTLESHPDILQPTINCLKEVDACTWTFSKVEGSPLKEIKGLLKYKEGQLTAGYFYMKDASFTIRF
jgi:hypothetical protein